MGRLKRKQKLSRKLSLNLPITWPGRNRSVRKGSELSSNRLKSARNRNVRSDKEQKRRHKMRERGASKERKQHRRGCKKLRPQHLGLPRSLGLRHGPETASQLWQL